MAELRYRAGNIRNPEVHKVGIIALGSHLENHGPALPIDTDAKIGAHIAFQSSLKSGAKYLGIIKITRLFAHHAVKRHKRVNSVKSVAHHL